MRWWRLAKKIFEPGINFRYFRWENGGPKKRKDCGFFWQSLFFWRKKITNISGSILRKKCRSWMHKKGRISWRILWSWKKHTWDRQQWQWARIGTYGGTANHSKINLPTFPPGLPFLPCIFIFVLPAFLVAAFLYFGLPVDLASSFLIALPPSLSPYLIHSSPPFLRPFRSVDLPRSISPTHLPSHPFLQSPFCECEPGVGMIFRGFSRTDNSLNPQCQ